MDGPGANKGTARRYSCLVPTDGVGWEYVQSKLSLALLLITRGSIQTSRQLTASDGCVSYLFLFPAEPPADFPPDPGAALDLEAGVFFPLEPFPLLLRSSWT